jgi:hypothetical protein
MSQPLANYSRDTIPILKDHKDSKEIIQRLQQKTGGRCSNPAIKFSDFVNGANTTFTMFTRTQMKSVSEKFKIVINVRAVMKTHVGNPLQFQHLVQ